MAIIAELYLNADFNRSELERFLKLTGGSEILVGYDDNGEVYGLTARLND